MHYLAIAVLGLCCSFKLIIIVHVVAALLMSIMHVTIIQTSHFFLTRCNIKLYKGFSDLLFCISHYSLVSQNAFDAVSCIVLQN